MPLFALTQEASCANGATADQRSVHAAVTYSNGAPITHALDVPKNPQGMCMSVLAHRLNMRADRYYDGEQPIITAGFQPNAEGHR